MTLSQLTLPLVGLTTLSACGLDLQNELGKAVPDKEAVTINAPEGNGSALTSADADLGEWSEYYVVTRKITRGVNGGVVGMLTLVKWITLQPATSCDDDSCTWGPGSDTLDPAEYRLVVTKIDEGQYEYALQGRPKGSEDVDENYLDLITGTSDITSEINHGLGTMTVDIDNGVELDPTACGTGKIETMYDTTVEPQYLAVEFDNFRACEEDNAVDEEAPAAASYYYSRYEDGSGNFQFLAVGDVHDGAVQPAVDETFAIRSRWNGQGEGRSDVEISGGDLLAHDGLEAVIAAECWDAGFKLTYADISPLIIDPSHHVGDEASCPDGLQAPQPPDAF
jgi:hypothetical protein